MHQVYIYLSTVVLGSLPMMITYSRQYSMIDNFCMPCLDMLHTFVIYERNKSHNFDTP